MSADPADDLHTYLRLARRALLGKLDGLAEYDARRPLTPTGTNLLGLVKHLAWVEAGYFGGTFGRPFAEPGPWEDPDLDADAQSDLWATADESREAVLALHARATAHADATIEALPLDAEGHVAHWPAERNPVTLHRILVHVTAETHRHAGHADILRELLDGTAGLRSPGDNLPAGDTAWWERHRARVEQAARTASDGAASDGAASDGAASDGAASDGAASGGAGGTRQ